MKALYKNVFDTCCWCEGRGRETGFTEPCHYCKGQGKKVYRRRLYLCIGGPHDGKHILPDSSTTDYVQANIIPTSKNIPPSVLIWKELLVAPDA